MQNIEINYGFGVNKQTLHIDNLEISISSDFIYGINNQRIIVGYFITLDYIAAVDKFINCDIGHKTRVMIILPDKVIKFTGTPINIQTSQRENHCGSHLVFYRSKLHDKFIVLKNGGII